MGGVCTPCEKQPSAMDSRGRELSPGKKSSWGRCEGAPTEGHEGMRVGTGRVQQPRQES